MPSRDAYFLFVYTFDVSDVKERACRRGSDCAPARAVRASTNPPPGDTPQTGPAKGDGGRSGTRGTSATRSGRKSSTTDTAALVRPPGCRAPRLSQTLAPRTPVYDERSGRSGTRASAYRSSTLRTFSTGHVPPFACGPTTSAVKRWGPPGPSSGDTGTTSTTRRHFRAVGPSRPWALPTWRHQTGSLRRSFSSRARCAEPRAVLRKTALVCVCVPALLSVGGRVR